MSNVNNVNGNSNSSAAAKETLAARLAAAQAASNGNSNSNAAVAKTTVVKTDTVEVSQKSVALASAVKTDTASKVAVTPQEATTATISDPKVEKANKRVTAAEKSHDQRKNARKAMRENQRELRHLVKGLKKLGMGSREVSKIVRTANRKANKVVGKEIKQAYNDFRSHQINKQSFYNKLYGAAVKKLDGLVSALRNAYEQKAASSQSQSVTVKPIETMDPPKPVKVADNGEDKNAAAVKEKAEETKPNELFGASKARVTSAKEAAKANAEKSAEVAKEKANETSEKEVKTENGNIVKAEKEVEKAEKEEGKEVSNSGKGKGLGIGNGISGSGPGPINANENADKGFGQIVDFFNDIDKMINGFADIAEGKGNDDEDGDSLLSFASRLSDMFSGINKAFGRHEDDNVGFRLGMAQVKKETIGQLFNGGHGSGAINRIGDAGEGSGSFNAVSFMSSLSNSINDGLDAYKDLQKAEKESKDDSKEESEEAVSTVA